MMTQEAAETLSQIVSERAGTGRPLTFEALSARCVDPETGYRAGHNMLWKIATHQDVKINPKIVSAIAAGTGLPLERVAAAAAYQYTGYRATPVGGARVVHDPGVTASDLPKSRAVIDRWESEKNVNSSATSPSSGESQESTL